MTDFKRFSNGISPILDNQHEIPLAEYNHNVEISDEHRYKTRSIDDISIDKNYERSNYIVQPDRYNDELNQYTSYESNQYSDESNRYTSDESDRYNDESNRSVSDNKEDSYISTSDSRRYPVNQNPISVRSSRLYRERAISNNIRRGSKVEIDQIVVYLLTDRCKDEQVKALIKFFKSSSFYDLKVVDIPPPSTIDKPIDMTEEQAIEIYRFNKVLTEASDKYPNKYVLVIKDKTVTVTSPDVLESVVRTAVQLAGWQFCYLNRWLDACEQYTNKVNVDGDSMISLVKTVSPNSTQSILFSPEGRDIVIGRCRMNDGKYFTPIRLPLGEKLNREIINNNVTAICSVPNVFAYNLFDAQSVSDLAKLSECRRPIREPENDGPGTVPFIWFIIIVLIVFLALWALYILGPSNRSQDPADFQVEVIQN